MKGGSRGSARARGPRALRHAAVGLLLALLFALSERRAIAYALERELAAIGDLVP